MILQTQLLASLIIYELFAYRRFQLSETYAGGFTATCSIVNHPLSFLCSNVSVVPRDFKLRRFDNGVVPLCGSSESLGGIRYIHHEMRGDLLYLGDISPVIHRGYFAARISRQANGERCDPPASRID